MGQRTISIAELRAECRNLERAVRAAGLATEAELDPHRPGAAENTAKDARAWLRFYAVLHRKHARGEHSPSVNDGRQRADGAVLAALRDEPIAVDLVTPVPLDGELTTSTLYVYQKSLDALLQVHALDTQIGWLLIQRERVEQAGAAGMVGASQLHTKVMEAISYAYGLIAWIMTSPGPGVPYEVSAKGDPDLPPYVAALNPMDIPQIASAAQRHHARLSAVQALLHHHTQLEGGRRPSWSQFIGSLAIELDTDTVTLTRFRSLGSLLAAVQLSSDANRPDEKGSTTSSTSNSSASTAAAAT